jgi:predicted DNA-binding transcriptional regulator YafY
MLVMLQMLVDFMVKDKITARELAEEYELPTRTIMRYIEKMRDAGFPIDTIRGRNGYHTLTNVLYFNGIFFSNDELQDLTAIITIAKERNYLPKERAETLLKKIEIIRKKKK